MDKKFCDRCGAEIPTTGSFFKAVHTHTIELEEIGEPAENLIDAIADSLKRLSATFTGENTRIQTNTLELCRNCAELFEKWRLGE